MKKKYLTFFIIITIIFPQTLSRAAVDKSGVKPSVISLPSGPGSIEGLGESFEPQLNNGTFEYSFAVKLPPGVNGHVPSVSLEYDSGYGNGAFGLSWRLAIPYIQRQTDKGLPQYNDSDTFIYVNGEELVPLADQSFRTENESTFRHFKTKDAGWELRTRDGTLYRFGLYPSASNQGRQSRLYRKNYSFTETFRWYVDEIIDTNGNKIEYYYQTFDDSPGYLYCSEIRYSIFGNNYKAVVFQYEPRQDKLTDYRGRFPITIGRCCSHIRVISCNNGLKNLIRRYCFSYQKEESFPSEIKQSFSY